MSVEFCGLTLAHPVINGSGTFDAIAARRAFGDGLPRPLPIRRLRLQDDHRCSRAPATRRRGCGRPQAGMVNSIGLPNKGLEGYLEEDLPELADLPRHGADGGERGRAPDHQRDGLERG